MAEQRYCGACGTDVTCREERSGPALALYYPRCEKRLATFHGHIVIQ